jgi:hypothetical protein
MPINMSAPAIPPSETGTAATTRKREIDEIGIHFVFIEIASLPYSPNNGTPAGFETQPIDYFFRNNGIGSAGVPQTNELLSGRWRDAWLRLVGVADKKVVF